MVPAVERVVHARSGARGLLYRDALAPEVHRLSVPGPDGALSGGDWVGTYTTGDLDRFGWVPAEGADDA